MTYFTSSRGHFLKFCTVGVINTGVDVIVYYVLTRGLWTFHDSFSYYKAISYMAATTCSFILNRFWTFSRTGSVKPIEIIKFYSTVGLGIFLNVGAQYVAVQVFGLNDLLGVLLASGVTAVWGFSFSKLYVFRN